MSHLGWIMLWLLAFACPRSWVETKMVPFVLLSFQKRFKIVKIDNLQAERKAPCMSDGTQFVYWLCNAVFVSDQNGGTGWGFSREGKSRTSIECPWWLTGPTSFPWQPPVAVRWRLPSVAVPWRNRIPLVLLPWGLPHGSALATKYDVQTSGSLPLG